MDFPLGTNGKELICRCRRLKRCRFDPWLKQIPLRRAWQPTPVFLPGESHGQRSLVGYSPLGCKELDMTEGTWHPLVHALTFQCISRVRNLGVEASAGSFPEPSALHRSMLHNGMSHTLCQGRTRGNH